MDKLLLSLAVATAIFGAFYLGWLLVSELFNHYGVTAILGLVAFIGTWILCYLMMRF